MFIILGKVILDTLGLMGKYRTRTTSLKKMMVSKHHLKCQIWSWCWFLKVACSVFWAAFGLYLGSLGKKRHDWWWWLPCCLSANPCLSNVREYPTERQGEQNAWKGKFPFFPVLLWAVNRHIRLDRASLGFGEKTPGPSEGSGNAPILSRMFQEISFFLGRLNSCSWNSSLHMLSYFIRGKPLDIYERPVWYIWPTINLWNNKSCFKLLL